MGIMLKDLILLGKCWEAENVLRLGSDTIKPAFRVGQRLKAGLHEGTMGFFTAALWVFPGQHRIKHD